MERFEAIIFDFNGVLLWDTPLHDKAWELFSAEIRGVPFSEREMLTQVHGRTNRTIMPYLLGREPADAEIAELSAAKEEIYRQLCLAAPASFVLSPGAVDLLTDLRQRRIPFTIATSSGRENVDFYIEHLHLARWFDLDRIIFDDGSRPGKPAPDMYQAAAAAVDHPSARCIVVEDSFSGIESAAGAGIGCIIALGPAERRAELAAWPGVAMTIEKLSQFPENLLAYR